MKNLEQNWSWLLMIVVPLFITVINLSRNALMAAMSISADGFLVKFANNSRMPQNAFLADDDTGPRRRKIHENTVKPPLRLRGAVGIVLTEMN